MTEPDNLVTDSTVTLTPVDHIAEPIPVASKDELAIEIAARETALAAESGKLATETAARVHDVADAKLKSERLLRLISAVAAIMFVAIIGLSAVVISLFHKLTALDASVVTLDQTTKDIATDQQRQLDSLSNSIEIVRDDMEDGFAQQQDQISNLQQIQHNSNGAITRLRKEMDQLREDLERGLELRRQQIEAAMMYARNYGGSSNTFSAIGDYAQTLAGGVFELTAYEWTGNTCANGEYPVVGYTCASNYYPIGTRLYIEGLGERVVTDTGGMSNNVIDIYMGDVEACYQFGRQTAEVYVIED